MDLAKSSLLTPLRNIFNKHDLIGIYYGVENEDEYDPEIEELLRTLKRDEDPGALSRKIYEIFVRYFSEKLAGDRKQYDGIAHEILIILRRDS